MQVSKLTGSNTFIGTQIPYLVKAQPCNFPGVAGLTAVKYLQLKSFGSFAAELKKVVKLRNSSFQEIKRCPNTSILPFG